jgi:preprotein translocase subunit SecE
MMTPKGTAGAQLDLTRYVHILFIAGGGLAAYLAYNIINNVWARFSPDPSFPLLFAISLVAGGGLAFYFWQQERTRQLAQEVVGELSRVTWPTRPELGAATVVVIVTSIVMSIVLGLFDFLWSWVTTIIY